MSKNKQVKAEGFLNFKICDELFRGIARKGYQVPTHIQSQTIPLIIAGRNVVAMAPTGSGKTAAFLIPMFEKLKNPFFGESHSTGPRALIISPTRELALQTVKFASELGRFMSIKAAVLLGGERMDDDFKAIHENPDVIIATPARLLHLQVEMGSKFNLSNVEYVVFDEGDRLFELGMVEQLTETFNRLPKSRQTVIFSATLPANLVEFAKAGLDNPILVRPNLYHRLSDKLKMNNLLCTNEIKLPVLIELLQLIKERREQVIVFFASKHHVEYVSKILDQYGSKFDHVVVYSALDPEARRLNAEKFYKGEARVMLTTDIAARGIDIPELANMINFHFPDKPKLFQHRVGRVARAGKSGSAYSLVDNAELPYLMDTFMYLTKPFKMIDDKDMELDDIQANGYLGSVPASIVSDHAETIESIAKDDCEVKGLFDTCVRAFGKYNRTKKLASSESVKRSRAFIESQESMQTHPIFHYASQVSDTQMQFRALLKQSRPKRTIFETSHGKNENACKALFNLRKLKDYKDYMKVKNNIVVEKEDFLSSKCKSNAQVNYRVPNLSGPDAAEAGLALDNSGFAAEAKEAILELQNDESNSQIRAVGAKRQRMTWDRKRKRFVGSQSEGKNKKIRTESGAVISASYKTDAYERWLKTTNTGMIAAKTVSFEDDNNNADDGYSRGNKTGKKKFTNKKPDAKSFQLLNNAGKNRYKNQPQKPQLNGNDKNTRTLKPEQIMKKMREKEKVKEFQKSRRNINKKRK